MGNSASKPSSRQCSTSSTSPLSVDTSNPTTPTPLLTSFPKSTGRPGSHTFGPSPTSIASHSSPISPPSPTFTFPGRPNQAVDEIIVTSFAGDSPPGSRPVSTFPFRHSSTENPAKHVDLSGISQPTNARPNVRRLSELIDPTLLVSDDGKAIRSPSGNMLGRQSFEERLDRPLSMRERQESIRQQLMLQRSQGGLRQCSTASDNLSHDPEKQFPDIGSKGGKSRGGCCPCFGL